MERIDDLLFQDLHILQDDESACFSEDAVLLSSFLRLRPSDAVVDLGCGSGILCILGQGKTGARFTGVDWQEALLSMARRSADMNGQPIDFVCADVADAPALFGCGAFAAAVMNPPYFSAGEKSANASRALSRHGEDALNVFLRAAFLLLKNGGKLFLCYPADKLTDALPALRASRMEPKRLRLIAYSMEKAPYLALIEAKKLGKPGMKMERVQFLHQET